MSHLTLQLPPAANRQVGPEVHGLLSPATSPAPKVGADTPGPKVNAAHCGVWQLLPVHPVVHKQPQRDLLLPLAMPVGELPFWHALPSAPVVQEYDCGVWQLLPVHPVVHEQLQPDREEEPVL